MIAIGATIVSMIIIMGGSRLPIMTMIMPVITATIMMPMMMPIRTPMMVPKWGANV